MAVLRGVGIGAGYFSHYHYDGWSRIPEVEITAVCDCDPGKARAAAEKFGIPRFYADPDLALQTEKPDFVDIITPPATHLELCRRAAEQGCPIVCQKPLAPAFEEARRIVEEAERAGIPFAVHENWRFQPWYREIKTLQTAGAIGDWHSLSFRSRMGDGWGPEAYANRQPYFREYPRLLVYENGVHFIDTFRYLLGDVTRVYARLRKLNPAIRGEDRAVILFEYQNGAEAIWDANRFNETNRGNPRYTFGECLVEGAGGSIRLYADGTLTLQPLGKPETPHAYLHEDRGFAGDCVYRFQRHFIDCLLNGRPFETNGRDYLKTLAVQEAVYRSAETGLPEAVLSFE